MNKEKLPELQAKLGVTFQNEQLLVEALTHRSYVNEMRGSEIKHNERLEFLGDAVLELVVTHHLFLTYPNRPEGELTSFRAALVRTESLAEVAGRLELGKYIFMSRGEEGTGGRNRQYILANTVEALLGSIYLDQGFTACEKVIHELLIPKLDDIVNLRLDVDPKSKLQEVTQESVRITPTYTLITEVGPDHHKEFEMAVMIGDFQLASGKGKSKQEAEQAAASKALQNWPELYQKYASSAKILT